MSDHRRGSRDGPYFVFFYIVIDDRGSPAHTRAWIETRMARLQERSPARSPAHTRAWIETRCSGQSASRCVVARSHAGVDRNIIRSMPLPAPQLSPAHTRAWIETASAPCYRWPLRRRPLTRGRGSKHYDGRGLRPRTDVARSHAGVDRNRRASAAQAHEQRRPLTRGRGSKHIIRRVPVAK